MPISVASRRFFCILLTAFIALQLSARMAVAEALHIVVSPAVRLIDTPVRIRVMGAAPHSRVTVSASVDRFGDRFASSATFSSDRFGTVDVSSMRPSAGSYAGVDSMGFLWSMSSAGKSPVAFQFSPEYFLKPWTISVTARTERQSATVTFDRLVVAPNVVHVEKQEGSVIGALFHPASGGCFRGVLVLGGSDGNPRKEEAAILASHGFTTLAIALFGRPGLQPDLQEVPVETVEAAIAVLHADPSVCAAPVAIVGESKGAELGLLAATLLDGIAGVVAMSPSSVVFAGIGTSAHATSSWSWRKKPVPFVNGSTPDSVRANIAQQRAQHQKVSYRDEYLALLTGNTDPGAAIPVERIRGPVLLLAGSDDKVWPSDVMARQISDRLTRYGHAYADRLIIFPKAGHQIGMPYAMTGVDLLTSGIAAGGTALGNERADVAAWVEVLRFLDGLPKR